MTKFRSNVAVQCGINPAIIAEYLWYLLMNETEGDDACNRHGHHWCRCSARMMTAEFPFLSIPMAKRAIKVLSDRGYILKGCFNDDRFDHTNWYAFTGYGEKMMEAWWTVNE